MSADDRLADDRNLCNSIVEFRPLNPGGKSVGDVNIPPAMRTLIAATAQESGVKEAAKAFDLSPAGAAKIAKREVEAGRVEPKSDRIRDKALDSLASLFDSVITDDNLKGLKVREGIGAAKDLASVVERISPKTQDGPRVQFVVFAPRMRSEDEYETIDLPATPNP